MSARGGRVNYTKLVREGHLNDVGYFPKDFSAGDSFPRVFSKSPSGNLPSVQIPNAYRYLRVVYF